ncbi:hypothetical protein M8J75_009235 [Diaphorina citri]|nr:hypothetical protein M8J75_009235 [Diaphorina citri]
MLGALAFHRRGIALSRALVTLGLSVTLMSRSGGAAVMSSKVTQNGNSLEGLKYQDFLQMINWWDNDSSTCMDNTPIKPSLPTNNNSTKAWKFRVEAKTLPGEVVCVTGSSNELGQWSNDHALILTHEGENVWSNSANISSDLDVRYRYFVCIPLEKEFDGQQKLVVRRWETGMNPRIIAAQAPSNMNCEDGCDKEVFGQYNNSTSVEKGWLTSETAVQIKLVNNPIKLWKTKLRNHKISIKVTAMSLSRVTGESDLSSIDDGFSLETTELMNNFTSWPLTEISVMNENEREFRTQNQFGLDFYADDRGSDPSSGSSTDPPSHLGFSHILPAVLTRGTGSFIVPITNTQQRRPIGELSGEYLVVTPLSYRSDMKITFSSQWRHNWQGLLYLNMSCFYISLVLYVISGEYLVVTPLSYRSDMKITFSSQWRDNWQGLDVGHRGAGVSFGCADVRENTIASLRSAGQAGADLVEFDVQLSKDLVPVIYHDFYVALSTQRKLTTNSSEGKLVTSGTAVNGGEGKLATDSSEGKLATSGTVNGEKSATSGTVNGEKSATSGTVNGEKSATSGTLVNGGEGKLATQVNGSDGKIATAGGSSEKMATADSCGDVTTLNDVIKVPVKELTFDEMQMLTLYHVKEGQAKLKRRFSRDSEAEHQAFPTLRQVLEVIDPSVGFNIEIKWTMQVSDGTYELDHPIEINTYVDTILDVVLRCAGPRNIVFSCFHPDIVTMLRLKQNRYPVIFLTQGVTAKWPQYRDPRCHNVTMGTHHAVSASLLGLSVHTEDLLRDDRQVKYIKDSGLVVWCWGAEANDVANVRRLKQLGVQAVINDKVVQHSAKNESVFLIEAREAAKLLTRLK